MDALTTALFWLDYAAVAVFAATGALAAAQRKHDIITFCFFAAIIVWLMGRRGWRFRALLWLDALGVAGYAVVGTAKALNMDVPAVSAVIMGVLTTTFGGIIRDVLAGEPNLLLRREIYVTAALLGAIVFAAMQGLGLSFWPSALTGFAAGFGLRAAAIRFNLALPGFPGSKANTD